MNGFFVNLLINIYWGKKIISFWIVLNNCEKYIAGMECNKKVNFLDIYKKFW